MAKQTIKTINDRTYVINAFEGLTGWGFIPRLTKLGKNIKLNKSS